MWFHCGSAVCTARGGANTLIYFHEVLVVVARLSGPVYHGVAGLTRPFQPITANNGFYLQLHVKSEIPRNSPWILSRVQLVYRAAESPFSTRECNHHHLASRSASCLSILVACKWSLVYVTLVVAALPHVSPCLSAVSDHCIPGAGRHQLTLQGILN